MASAQALIQRDQASAYEIPRPPTSRPGRGKRQAQPQARRRKVATWENRYGVFLASTDPDASFIVALHDTRKSVAHAALTRHNRKTDSQPGSGLPA